MKLQVPHLLFLVLLSCLSYQSIFAQDIYYSRQSGSWKDPNTWATGSHAGTVAANPPGAASDDIVIIAAGHVVDYNADDDASNTATIGILQIGTSDGDGYLRFPFSNRNTNDDSELAGDYDLIITGDVTIAANGHLIAVQGGEENPSGNTMNGSAADRNGHDIFIGGSLSNAGVIDLQNDINTNYEVELHFTGTNNQTITGSGTWDTYNITYNNTGTSPNNQIINQSADFTTSVEAGRSNFTQGTYVHNNTGTYNNQALNNDGTDYTNVSFVVEQGVFNMASITDADREVILTNGNITVTGGQFNGGYNSIGGGAAIIIQVDGNVNVSGTGVLNIGDGDPGTSTIPTDGTLTIGGSSSSINGATFYTRDLVLSAGASLSLENGAEVSVGRGTGGSITLNGATSNGSSLTMSGATTQLTVYNRIQLGEECSFTINDGDVDITPATTITNNPESLRLTGSGSSFTMLDGTLDIMANCNDRKNDDDAIRLQGANSSIDIQGGTVVLGNTATGTGNIDFRQATSETTSLSISNDASVTVGNRIQRSTAGSISNITLANNTTFLVGTDNSSGNVDNMFHEGTLTISDNATARFGRGGDLDNVTITGSGTLETGTTGGTQVDINGTFTYSSAIATCTFFRGMDIEADANLNISAGTINFLPDATTASDTRMQIRGDLLMNGGTINLGASITDITNGNLLQVYDGGTFTINTGTFSMLASPALTSLAYRNPLNNVNKDAGEDDTQGDGVVTIGDGSGSANTAQLIIAPNLAAELPSPSTRNILDMDGANSVLTINSDGYLGVGGGNIGNLRLNTYGARFVKNGGTCDITASQTIDNGTSVEVNGGVLNVGTSSSNGTNRLIYSANPTAITRLTNNNGTINVGDGNSQLIIGNDNENPAFGTVDAFSILEITGGALNLNGSFNLDDANARFVMSGGNFNLNPQCDHKLDSDIDIFD